MSLAEDFAGRVAKMRAAARSGCGLNLARVFYPWLNDNADRIVAALRKAEAPTHDEAILAAIQRYDDWIVEAATAPAERELAAIINQLREGPMNHAYPVGHNS